MDLEAPFQIIQKRKKVNFHIYVKLIPFTIRTNFESKINGIGKCYTSHGNVNWHKKDLTSSNLRGHLGTQRGPYVYFTSGFGRKPKLSGS